MGRRTPEAQLAFVEDAGHNWTAPKPVGKPPELERKLKPPRIITFSQIERIIYEKEGVESRGIFNANLAIGTATDYFLLPAQFINRNRADYCFDPNDPRYNKSWDLETVFSNHYPTGYKSEKEKYLELLKYFRKSFTEKNPLRPGNSQMERWLIKQRLIPLWNEIAQSFNLDSLALQYVMNQDGNFLMPSGRFASKEQIKDTARRIVVERFDHLVDDDLNYTLYAKPDFRIAVIINGVEYSILFQPDAVKRLREEKKSVQTRLKKGEVKKHKRVVAKRIVEDLKDSTAADFSDLSTPFGKATGIYNMLAKKAGQGIKFGPKSIRWLYFPNDQGKWVFDIPSSQEPNVPEAEVLTVLEYLREDADKMTVPMPSLSQEEKEYLQNTLEQALLASQQSKLQ